MALTEQQKNDVREEEFLRAEIRKSLASKPPEKTAGERISDFFDGKVGYWLLTTVLAGGVGFGFSQFQQYLAREEIKERRATELAHRDTDLGLKLAPLMFSSDIPQVSAAAAFLKNLKESKAMKPALVDQLLALQETALVLKAKPGASNEQKQAAGVQAAAIDIPGAMTIKEGDVQPAKPGDSTSAATLSATQNNLPALPPRIYIHYADRSQLADVELATKQLLAIDVLVPPKQMVEVGIPKRSNLRYCPDKIEKGVLEKTMKAISGVLIPDRLPLKASLCTRVRINHMELWLANPL
ncbi:MAG: hypothetical protein WBK51_01335 [Polaromonas sp.]